MDASSDRTARLLETVSHIYAAPGSLDGWQSAVESLNALVGGRASVYLLVNKETLSNEITAFCGFRGVDVTAYEGPNGAAKDVRFQYLHNLVPGRVFREFEYVTDRAAWDASEWIQYQAEHLGCYWCMSAQVSTHGLWQDFISVNRLRELGPHTDREKADLQTLLPHLARAAELHRALSSLERRFGAVLSVLDRFLVGLVILDQRRRVVVSNSTAQAVCEQTGALRITRDGYLKAGDPDANAALADLLDRAVGTAVGAGLDDGGQLALRRGDAYLVAEVVPLRDEGLPDGSGVSGAAVFLMHPDLSRVVSLQGIAQIFGLTRTETEVAGALSNGDSLAAIAEQRGVSLETVRKQLKSVFAKTGATSQLDLLRLATKANPPIRTD